MANTNETLDWLSVETSDFAANGPLGKAYATLSAKRDAMNKARDAFEEEFTKAAVAKDMIPEGQELRFGYRFGKLAIAFAAKSTSKSGGSAKKFTLG